MRIFSFLFFFLMSSFTSLIASEFIDDHTNRPSTTQRNKYEHLKDLSAHLITKIKSYSDAQDLLAMRLVCKMWSDDEDQWKELIVNEIQVLRILKDRRDYPQDVLSYRNWYRTIDKLQSLNAFNTRRDLFNDSDLSDFITEAFSERKSLYIIGFLKQLGGESNDVVYLGHYVPSCNQGYKPAQASIASAIYNGIIDGHQASPQQRFLALSQMADNNEEAQKMVDKAIITGDVELGQDRHTGEKRFQLLLSRARQGDKYAQELVPQIIYNGELGQNKRLEEERFQELSDMAMQGDSYAQCCVCAALYQGTLGQSNRSETERFQELLEKSRQGDQHAEKFIISSFFNGYLGQNNRLESIRFQEISCKAERRNKQAQSLMHKAIYEGKLGQANRSEEERFQELLTRAERGDKDAQGWVSTAIAMGGLNQTDLSDEERFQKLKVLAKRGYEGAQSRVNEAICAGTLGQDRRPMKEYYKELLENALHGDLSAHPFVKKIMAKNFNLDGIAYLDLIKDIFAIAN